MTAKQILPPETSEAIRRMIEITQKIKALAEREADAIETQDAEALGAIIAQKSDLSLTYEKAGKEFHARLAEFQASADKELLRTLDAEHDALSALTAKNSIAYNRIVGGKAG